MLVSPDTDVNITVSGETDIEINQKTFPEW